jgi:DNA-directed RNA polymerase II subunit RPB3
VDVCPDRILELDEVSAKLTVSEYAWEIATYTEDLKVAQDTMKEKPEDDDFVTVEHSTDRFIFSVEGTGAMDVEEVLMSSMRVLKERLQYLSQQLEQIREI